MERMPSNWDGFPEALERAVQALKQSLLAEYEKENASRRKTAIESGTSREDLGAADPWKHWDMEGMPEQCQALGKEAVRSVRAQMAEGDIQSVSNECFEEEDTGRSGIAGLNDITLEDREEDQSTPDGNRKSQDSWKPVESSASRNVPTLKSGFRQSSRSDNSVDDRPSFSEAVMVKVVRCFEYAEKVYQVPYEAWFALIVFFNVVFLIGQLEYQSSHDEKEMEDEFFAVSFAFCVVFLIDIVYRMYRERWEFVHGKTNWIDLIVVVTMSVGIILELAGGDGSHMRGLSALRLIRVVNLIRRVLRLRKHLEKVPEIRLLSLCLALTMRLLLVVCIMLFFTLSFAAIPITQEAVHECRKGNDMPLCDYFGSFFRSLLTLYQAMFSGLLWGDLWDALLPVDLFTKVVFLVFISFSFIVLGNMISLVFHTVGHKVFDDDKVILLEKERKSRQYFYNQLRELFNAMDINGSGALSMDEIEIALEEQEVCNHFASLDITLQDLSIVFADVENGTGAVGIEEFLCGCHRMKGPAKAADFVTLHAEVQTLLHYVLEVLRITQSASDPTSSARMSKPRMSIAAPGRAVRASVVPGQSSSIVAQPVRGRSSIEGKTQKPVRSTQRTQRRSSLLSEDARVLGDFANLEGHHIDAPLAFRVKSGCRIKRVEERAMTIAELIDVNDNLALCQSEDWKDLRTGSDLDVEEVNLYNFAYHFILPKTVPNGITLELFDSQEDLLFSNVEEISIIQMQGSVVIAEGIVTDVLTPQSLMVFMIKGQFHASGECPGSVLKINGKACGNVQKVNAYGACSYKELVSSKPAKPLWFCSHWWGEPVHNFVLACEGHRRYRGIDEAKATYWICAYANRQWGEELAADIGESPEESSFARAMVLAEGVLVFLDSDAVVFTRIWCCFELFTTLTSEGKRFDITTIVTSDKGRRPKLLSDGPLPNEAPRNQMHREEKFPIHLLAKGLVSRLEDGDATHPSDKQMILKCFGGEKSPELENANNVLHGFFAKAAWPQAVKKGIVGDFDMTRPGLVSLPKILKRNERMKTLSLSIEHCQELTNREIELLADGLPTQLLELRLSFEGCSKLTSDSLVKLAPSLPHSLKLLKLDFLGCQDIGDQALGALASFLQSLSVASPTGLHHQHGLKELHLHFDRCSGITKNGIIEMARSIPRSVQTLSATFRGTPVDRNFKSVKDLKKFAKA